jgi:hypothetical protein
MNWTERSHALFLVNRISHKLIDANTGLTLWLESDVLHNFFPGLREKSVSDIVRMQVLGRVRGEKGRTVRGVGCCGFAALCAGGPRTGGP